MRVAGGAEGRIFGRGTHCELVEVRLADGNGSGGTETLHRSGGVRRLPALEDLRRACGGNPSGTHVVFHGERHTGERANLLSCRDAGVDDGCTGTGLIGEHQVEGVYVTLTSRDSRQVFINHAESGARTGLNGRDDLYGVHGASPKIGGTRKRP